MEVYRERAIANSTQYCSAGEQSVGKPYDRWSKRNLSNKIIDNFELGFAPNSWNDLFNYLSKVEKFPINLILASGLAISKDNSDKIYDRFRNRLIVPIHDMQ